MSNVKCFADRITYDDHPMNTNCTGTPIPVTIPIGVCTPVATGERIAYKLIKPETYTCRSESVVAQASKCAGLTQAESTITELKKQVQEMTEKLAKAKKCAAGGRTPPLLSGATSSTLLKFVGAQHM